MNAGEGPRVLIALPTLGQRPELLRRTLASLRQSPNAALDIVIVTPRDGFVVGAAAREYGAQLVIADGHISAAVNRAFAEAGPQHRYAGWIGDDDMVVAEGISRGVAALEREPKAVMCFGDCEFIDIDGKTLFLRRPPPAATWLMQFVPGLIKSEACLFRLEALRAAGGLDESLRYAMDLDLILHLRRLGPSVRTRGPSGRFCLHEGSITLRNRAASFEEAQRVQLRWAGPALTLVARVLQPLLFRLFMVAAGKIRAKSALPE